MSVSRLCLSRKCSRFGTSSTLAHSPIFYQIVSKTNHIPKYIPLSRCYHQNYRDTERADTQLRRPLPVLRQLNRTSFISGRGQVLCNDYIFAWDTFPSDVTTWIESLDLSFDIPSEGSREEEILVGNEAGLVGRFNQNVGVPVTRVLQHIPGLKHIRFGDAQSSASYNHRLLPDIILLSAETGSVFLTGEVKPFWLLKMGTSDDPEFFITIQEPLGQLVTYMIAKQLRYGFLTTYIGTMFVRRSEKFRFEVSNPVLYNSSDPSVRECFLYIANQSISDGRTSPPDYYGPEITDLLFQRSLGSVRRQRISPVRSLALGSSSNISSNSIVIGIDNNNFSVKVREQLSERIFSVEDDAGNVSILKHWDSEEQHRFQNEVAAYEAIEKEGYSPYFATLRAFGPVVMSNLLSSGFAVILSERSGTPFSDSEWHRIGGSGRASLKSKLVEAVSVLRKIGVYHGDPAKSNILYSHETEELTVLDLEDVFLNSRNYSIAEGPESTHQDVQSVYGVDTISDGSQESDWPVSKVFSRCVEKMALAGLAIKGRFTAFSNTIARFSGRYSN